MTISAVLFDAGNILYTRPRRARVYTDFFVSRGLPDLDMKTPEFKRLKLDSHEGLISEDEYYEEVMRRGGITQQIDFDTGKKAFREAMLDFDFTDGVAEVLHTLKNDGLKLGIVTNTYNSTKEKMAWFKTIGIDTVWDSFATSCEIRAIKPSPEIYLAALEPFGGNPYEAIFVAHAQREIDGAKALGMTTVVFNRDDETVRGDYILDKFIELPVLVASLR
ncbi:MAG: HAD-IA family hydrolase [Desulfobacterales bacterium]|nr:HAD-IA family hydrolase [Desulfobacterales bacterium]